MLKHVLVVSMYRMFLVFLRRLGLRGGWGLEKEPAPSSGIYVFVDCRDRDLETACSRERLRAALALSRRKINKRGSETTNRDHVLKLVSLSWVSSGDRPLFVTNVSDGKIKVNNACTEALEEMRSKSI